MTIVVIIKVGDGVVMGSDSATTMKNGGEYHNSYFTAEKLFNLVKGLPIGLVTYGLGHLDSRSISWHAKELRRRLSDQASRAWGLNPKSYSMAEIANKVRRYFYDELYLREFSGSTAKPVLGFMLAGYSAGTTTAEVWRIDIDANGQCPPARLKSPASEPFNAFWEGSGSDAILRIWNGFSAESHNRLIQAGLAPNVAEQILTAPTELGHSAMPIQEAIDLLHYVIDVSCGFIRFAPGHQSVAKPIDSAAITRHEGFRWIRRKHYYTQELNLQHERE